MYEFDYYKKVHSRIIITVDWNIICNLGKCLALVQVSVYIFLTQKHNGCTHKQPIATYKAFCRVCFSNSILSISIIMTISCSNSLYHIQILNHSSVHFSANDTQHTRVKVCCLLCNSMQRQTQKGMCWFCTCAIYILYTYFYVNERSKY